MLVIWLSDENQGIAEGIGKLDICGYAYLITCRHQNLNQSLLLLLS